MDENGQENAPQAPPENAPDSSASVVIVPEDEHGQGYLPPLAPIRSHRAKSTAVYDGVRQQVDALREAGALQPYHAGQVALALATAQAVDDEIATSGKAYGKAQLLSALNAVIENLPTVDAEASSDLDATLHAILEDAAEGLE